MQHALHGGKIRQNVIKLMVFEFAILPIQFQMLPMVIEAIAKLNVLCRPAASLTTQKVSNHHAEGTAGIGRHRRHA